MPDSVFATLRGVFWGLIFLHALAALYLYGIPQFSNSNLRIIDIYVGFSIFFFIFVDRSFVPVESISRITSGLIWLPVIIHMVFSIRFFLQRLLRKAWDSPLPYYTGGKMIRDLEPGDSDE